MTLAKLGEMVGLSKSSLCEIESGRKRLGPEKAKVVEAITGIPRHELRPDLWDKPFITQDGVKIDRKTGKSVSRVRARGVA